MPPPSSLHRDEYAACMCKSRDADDNAMFACYGACILAIFEARTSLQMFFYSTPRKTQGRWGQCAVRRKQPAVEAMTNGTHEELTFSSKPQPYPTCLSSKGLIFLSIHGICYRCHSHLFTCNYRGQPLSMKAPKSSQSTPLAASASVCNLSHTVSKTDRLEIAIGNEP